MTTKVDVQINPLKKNKKKELACAISGSAVNGGVIELDSKNSHTLTFQLSSGSGYKFVDQGNEPFCSNTDNCPTTGNTNQFKNANVSPDKQTLTVSADPSTDPIVHYALRLNDGTEDVMCDPIIINN